MGPTILMNHAAICEHTVYVAAVVFMKTTIVLNVSVAAKPPHSLKENHCFVKAMELKLHPGLKTKGQPCPGSIFKVKDPSLHKYSW